MKKYKFLFDYLIILLVFFNVYYTSNQFFDTAIDLGVYCGAVKALKLGKDPYVVDNLVLDEINTGLPFRYPPITLLIFPPLCMYRLHNLFYTIILVILYFVVKSFDKKFDGFYLQILFLVGFMAVYHNFTSGNIPVIELIFLTFAIYCVFKKKYYTASMFIGIMGIFKYIPLVYASLFLLAPISFSKRIKAVLIAPLTLGILHLVSYIIFPSITKSYYKLLFFGYPMVDQEGLYNPSVFSIIKYIAHQFPYFLYVFFIITIIILYFIMIKKLGLTYPEKFLLGILSIMVILPELKPYTYIFAIIPIYFLTKTSNVRTRFYNILIIGLLPLISITIYYSNKTYMDNVFAVNIWCWFGMYFSFFIFYIMLCSQLIRRKILGGE